jgi:hypothetical protein
MALQETDAYRLAHRRGPGPGHPVDTGRDGTRTRVAQAYVLFGHAVQRDPRGCRPLQPGGVFDGIAMATRVTSDGIGGFDQYDNVPVASSGRWWGIADRAFAEGVGLNWNSGTGRWTDQPAGGAIVATPGVEADERANGNGHEIHIRIKRVRT